MTVVGQPLLWAITFFVRALCVRCVLPLTTLPTVSPHGFGRGLYGSNHVPINLGVFVFYVHNHLYYVTMSRKARTPAAQYVPLDQIIFFANTLCRSLLDSLFCCDKIRFALYSSPGRLWDSFISQFEFISETMILTSGRSIRECSTVQGASYFGQVTLTH